MSKQQWNPALRNANRAKKYVSDKSQKAQLKQLYGKLDAEGQKLLKKSKEAFDNKAYLEAITGYEDICCTFGHLPCAVAAKEALKQAEYIPEAKGVLQDRKACKLTKMLEDILNENQEQVDDQCATGDEATGEESELDNDSPTDTEADESCPAEPQLPRVKQIKSLGLGKQAKAIRLMEKAAKQYPLSQVGKQAAEALEVLRKDEAFQGKLKKYVQTQDAERLYKLAETYRNANLIPKALEYYKQLIEKFPGTNMAGKAKKRVAALEK